VWAVPGRIFQALSTQIDRHVVFIYKIIKIKENSLKKETKLNLKKATS
jgi:hypothetical protein